MAVHYYWYIKVKIRTYDDKVYTNFCDLNIPEDNIKCEYFTVISIASSFVCNKKDYLQVFLENRAYKGVNKQITDYLNENSFKD